MIIRNATSGDLDSIMVLERDGFGSTEQWSTAAWRAELDGSDRQVFVAEASGALIGVISIQVLAPSSDLMRVVIDPGSRRNGVASRLIMTALAAAAAAGATRMLLEVRYDNDAAIACYGRAGFEQLTVRKDYYGPGQDALVMRAWDLHTQRPQMSAIDPPNEVGRLPTSGVAATGKDVDHG